jgi:hypothetical protein
MLTRTLALESPSTVLRIFDSYCVTSIEQASKFASVISWRNRSFSAETNASSPQDTLRSDSAKVFVSAALKCDYSSHLVSHFFLHSMNLFIIAKHSSSGFTTSSISLFNENCITFRLFVKVFFISLFNNVFFCDQSPVCATRLHWWRLFQFYLLSRLSNLFAFDIIEMDGSCAMCFA